MDECKETSTPGDVNVQVNDSEAPADPNLYRSIVGSLLYASTCTRPDITHAANIASRQMSTPSETHMRAAKKILRYLAGCDNYALRYSSSNNNNNNHSIVAYCDADWGGDKTDRKSTTGYCVYLDGVNLVSWNTKKQPTVALDSRGRAHGDRGSSERSELASAVACRNARASAATDQYPI